MIRPRNETEDLLYSITKNCETLIKQTDTKAQQTFEFKKIKARETFDFNPPIPIERFWMIDLTDLEVYSSIFNITEKNNKFKVYKFPDETSGGFSYEKIRDEVEKDLEFTDVIAADLQDDMKASMIIEEFGEQVTK